MDASAGEEHLLVVDSFGHSGAGLSNSHSSPLDHKHHLHSHSYSHSHHHHFTTNYPSNQSTEFKVCEWESCARPFMDMQAFVRHLNEDHVNQPPKEKNKYVCLWANCKRNDQEFNARYKLLIHMRVHSGEKPYPCNTDKCKKSFSRLENLKIHVRSHTGEKPYKCNYNNCSKSFTNSSDRIKHHKTHRDPKPYSCHHNNCVKRYTDPSSLRKHLRAHKRLTETADLKQLTSVVPSSAPHHAHHSTAPSDASLFDPMVLLSEAGIDSDVGVIEVAYKDSNRLTSSSSSSSGYHSGQQVTRQGHAHLVPLNTVHHYQQTQCTQQSIEQQHNQYSQSWSVGSSNQYSSVVSFTQPERHLSQDHNHQQQQHNNNHHHHLHHHHHNQQQHLESVIEEAPSSQEVLVRSQQHNNQHHHWQSDTNQTSQHNTLADGQLMHQALMHSLPPSMSLNAAAASAREQQEEQWNGSGHSAAASEPPHWTNSNNQHHNNHAHHTNQHQHQLDSSFISHGEQCESFMAQHQHHHQYHHHHHHHHQPPAQQQQPQQQQQPHYSVLQNCSTSGVEDGSFSSYLEPQQEADLQLWR